jgi:hypothetical protein
VLTALLAGAAAAQTLGDAARRADEQRKKSTTPPMVIGKLPPTPADNGPVRLDADVLRRYGQARQALADLRRADRPLHKRLRDGFFAAHHYDELEPLFAGEPDVVTLLGTYKLTAAAYVQIEAAIRRGREFGQYPTLSMEGLSKRDAENVDFVKANLYLVNDIWRRCEFHEGGLNLIGRIPSYR